MSEENKELVEKSTEEEEKEVFHHFLQPHDCVITTKFEFNLNNKED